MRFLVGLDGSPEADAALVLLEALRLRATDEVLVVTAVEVATGLGTFAGPPDTLAWYSAINDVARSECRTLAESAVARLERRVAAVPIVVEGHPLHALQRVALERAADVVVVGPHGRGRLEALLFGSVSQGLLHWLRRPVLVARPLRGGLRSIVLAVDGSTHALAAARFLARLALPEDASVTCVAVLPDQRGLHARHGLESVNPLVVQAEEELAARAVGDAEAALADSGIAVRRSVVRGDVKRTVLTMAATEQADLIVLGARGLGGFESLVLGRVSRAVSKAATCSVLVVPSR